jgi:ubiquinone/menaquinone biosynthesis C-methylase UbiE
MRLFYQTMSTVAAGGGYWDRASAHYDRQLRLERRAVRAAVGLSCADGGSRVLDVATGTGVVLAELARLDEPPREAVGVDASAGMLARVPPLPPGWRTVRARAEEMPFGAGAFGVAFASYLLHILAPGERAAVLAEVRRVLAPGGRLVTVTPVVPQAFAGPFWALAGRISPGLRPLDPRPGLEAAGFRPERARIVGRGYPSLCVAAEAA